MNEEIAFKLMEQLQQQISEKLNGQKVDIYYKEEYGVLVVPHNAPLHPNNVIVNIPEMFFSAMTTFKMAF